jgi:cell division protein FtsL
MNGFDFSTAGADVTFTFVGKASGLGMIMYLILFVLLAVLAYFIVQAVQQYYNSQQNIQ